MRRLLKLSACLAPAALLAACATPPKAYDYTAYKAALPRSIVVLPPLNNTPDVNAANSLYAQVTYPLAEAGYYVLPVALVGETFKQNGLTTAADIHAVDAAKLKEVFGADAALYLTITNYGATYAVVNSVVVVRAQAKLVDLKSGAVLWQGTASANNDTNNNSGGGLAGLLVAAIVKQILNSTTDASHVVAGVASQRLLSGGMPNGVLYGPRSAKFTQQ